MKTENYKVIIQWYGSDAEDVLFYKDKKEAFDEYDFAYRDSCIRCAYLFSPNGELIYD